MLFTTTTFSRNAFTPIWFRYAEYSELNRTHSTAPSACAVNAADHRPTQWWLKRLCCNYPCLSGNLARYLVTPTEPSRVNSCHSLCVGAPKHTSTCPSVRSNIIDHSVPIPYA
jgi:hypothetical protein